MAILNDLIVSGASRFVGSVKGNTIQMDILKVPTTNGGTEYGPGANGQVLKSNGNSVYWGTDAGYTHPTFTAQSQGLYKITVNNEGHVTGVAPVTKADITGLGIPGSDTNTDTKVTQTVTTANATYPLLLAPNGQTATATTTSYFDSGVTLNPSTNTIAANISGNAATATKASALTDITTTDLASSSTTWRRIWMGYANNTTGRPAYDDRFAIQTSTGTLKAPIFSGALSGGIKDYNDGTLTKFGYSTSGMAQSAATWLGAWDATVSGEYRLRAVKQADLRVAYATSAGSATKATQDGNGNVIASTYLPLTGGTLTGMLGVSGITQTEKYQIQPEGTAAGWYRCAEFTRTNASSPFLILSIGRSYYSPQNEGYVFCITLGYNGDVNISQIAGHIGGHLLPKIRVDYINSGKAYVDFYMESNGNASYKNTWYVGGYGNATLFTPYIVTAASGTTYEFTTVQGMKNNGNIYGTLKGNADSATKATQDSDGNIIKSTYLKLSGGTMTGALNAHGGITLNSSTAQGTLQYILGIKAFADGGNVIWQTASNVTVGKANALTVNAGNAGQPVYFTGGVPTAIDWHIGNSGVGEHNCNNVTYNFSGYYTSNGPATSLGPTTNDGALWAQAYSSSWVAQMAQDYRDGSLYVRGKNSGTWMAWQNVILGNGYQNVGPIKLITGAGANNITTNYISAGRGYSTGSGLNGLKLVATEQDDAISGIGQDCTGKAYELSVAAAVGTSGQGYITFVGHKMASLSTYSELGHFNFANSTFYVNGKIGVGTTSPSYAVHAVGDVYANGGWLRSSGDTGWYNQTYGGGWYMTDGTYIRSYSSKALFINNNIHVGTTAGGGTGLSLYGTSAPTSYGIHMSTTANYGKHGDVQSDWATYFNMNAVGQRGWIYRAGSTNVASISANGIGAFKGIMGETGHIVSPDGGRYTTTTSSLTGYLKITLPVSWTNAMIRFTVDIYDYSNDNTVTYIIGGYNYSDSPGWHSTSAQCISKWGTSKSNLDVRFGHDGSKCAIYIGAANTSWSYPQVIVRDVLIGYGQASQIATWSKGWSIGFTTTLGSSIVAKTNTNVGYSVNYASSAGTASIATKTGDGGIYLYAHNSNEINFGGSNTSTTMYFGYRAMDSRAIPTKFIFGGSNGSASLQANTVYLGSGTSSYISSSQYTGNAATASSSPKLTTSGSLTSSNIDSFLETGVVKWGTGDATAVGNNDGIVVSFGWSASYGAQMWLDDGSGEGGMKIRNRNGGTTWNPWRQVLTENNYTNYTVSKTGSGASGTWSISISGNAATATNADKLDGYHASSFGMNYNVGNANLNAQTNSGFYRLGGTITNGFTNAAWGQMLVVHGAGDTIGQIGIPYNESGLYVRQGNPSDVGGSGSWKSWVRMLDSSNYSSYALPLSGGTLSGNVTVQKASGSTIVSVNHTSIGKINLQVSDSGNKGIYDSTHEKWLIYSGSDNITKVPANQTVSTAAVRNIKIIAPGTSVTPGTTAIPTGEVWMRYE